MIDKKTDQFDDLDNKKDDHFEFADDFSDDFDLDDEDPFKQKEKAKRDSNSNSYDNYDADLDADSRSEPSRAQVAPSFMDQVVDFAKGYGLPILLVGGLGYFGLKYSLGAMFGNDSAKAAASTSSSTTTQTVQFTDKNSSVNKLVGLTANAKQDKDIKDAGSTIQSVTPPVATVPATSVTPVAAANKELNTITSPVTPVAPVNSGSNLTEENKKTTELKSTAAPNLSPLSTEASNPNNDIAKFQNEIKNINAQLDAKLGDNTATVNQIKQQMQQLSVYVQGIGKAMSILSTTVKRQEEILTALVDSTVGKSVTKKSGANGLILEALIPGRAWFRAKSGKEITVGVGDMLPGYGKVIKIDSKKGAVTLSNGTVLTQ